MSAVTDYIDAHFDETLAKLARWVAQPSISTENIGIEDMAALVAQGFRESGFEVNIYPTGRFPVVLATAGPEGAPTVLIYNHYDVQPVGNLAEWTSPPFEPQIRGDKMYGRGVADTKSNIVSRLDALNAVKAVRGELPLRVVWLIEGGEEIGSPYLDQFVAEHAAELQAQGCIWEFGGHTWDGTPEITIGLKGMLTVELVARGANRDLHSGNASHIQSPVWRLVWALSAIKTPDGRIQIPDFYSSVVVPNREQRELVANIPDETQRQMETWGLKSYINDMKGVEVHTASAFAPTANILGIEAGYNGPGSKTVLPREAHAKLDIRLVPDQEPQAIFEALQAFLKDKGFDDIEVQRVANEGDLLPAVSSPADPFIRLVIEACREVSGREPVVVPSSSGSGPLAPFALPKPRGLGIPTAMFGTGYPDTRAHGPDENIRLSDMRAHMYTIARLVELLTQA